MGKSFAERLAREHAEVAPHLPASVVGAAARADALRRAADAGLPGLRDEGWRYADLRPLAPLRIASAAGPAPTELASPLPAPLPGVPRLVFVNGRFAATLSADPKALDGATLRTLGSGAAPHAPAATDFPEATADERFAWLNDAFAVDGARLDVQGTAQAEVIFVAQPTGDGGASHPRLEVRLAPGARLTLVERHLGGSAGMLTNAAARISLARDATLEHLRLQACAPDAVVLDTLLAGIGAGASYGLTQLNLGAAAARSALHIDLNGEAGALDLRGLSIADERRVLDLAIQVTHHARRTASAQLLRAIANGRAGIGIASRVDVAASAGGAASQQSLKGLLGGPGAEVNLRPQLEISTDEVKASHGATTGALDESMLFYLLSRGLDPATARQLLEWAFLEDVLSRIPLPALRRQVELATLERLGNTAAAEALA